MCILCHTLLNLSIASQSKGRLDGLRPLGLGKPVVTNRKGNPHRFPLSIGATGFEPATPCTPCKCASQAAPRPDYRGFGSRARTLCLDKVSAFTPNILDLLQLRVWGPTQPLFLGKASEFTPKLRILFHIQFSFTSDPLSHGLKSTRCRRGMTIVNVRSEHPGRTPCKCASQAAPRPDYIGCFQPQQATFLSFAVTFFQ
jgi:hypothetical protein